MKKEKKGKRREKCVRNAWESARAQANILFEFNIGRVEHVVNGGDEL